MKRIINQCILLLLLLLIPNLLAAQICPTVSDIIIGDESPTAYQFTWNGPLTADGYNIVVEDEDGVLLDEETDDPEIWIDKSIVQLDEIGDGLTVTFRSRCGDTYSIGVSIETILEVDIVYGKCQSGALEATERYVIYDQFHKSLLKYSFTGECLCDFVAEINDGKEICEVRDLYNHDIDDFENDIESEVILHFGTPDCLTNFCDGRPSHNKPKIQVFSVAWLPKTSDLGTTYHCYPNPAAEEITIELEEEIQNGTLEIYRLDGTLVFTQRLDDQQKRFIVTHNLDSGIYLTRISSQEKTSGFSKVIISK